MDVSKRCHVWQMTWWSGFCKRQFFYCFPVGGEMVETVKCFSLHRGKNVMDMPESTCAWKETSKKGFSNWQVFDCFPVEWERIESVKIFHRDVEMLLCGHLTEVLFGLSDAMIQAYDDKQANFRQLSQSAIFFKRSRRRLSECFLKKRILGAMLYCIVFPGTKGCVCAIFCQKMISYDDTKLGASCGLRAFCRFSLRSS